MSSIPPAACVFGSKSASNDRIEVIQNASFAIAYLVPDDTDDVFENGGHIGVVGDEPADIDVVAGFEVGQQFQQDVVGKTGIDEPVETLVALVVEKGANVAERLRGKAILVCQFTMQVGFFDIIARYDFFDVAIEGQER